MNKFAKITLAAMLAMTTVAAVGCSQETKKEDTAQQPAKVDATKTQKAVFAAALIAESAMANQFEATKKGIVDGKETALTTAKKDAAEAEAFLAAYWDKDLAKKEYEGYLGDAKALDAANAAIKALVDKGNVGKKEEEMKKFKPVIGVANDKFGANDISSAKAAFADAKVEEKDGKFTIEYKGLKYTLEKSGNTYKVVAKEGTLAK